ncbi:MAG: LCP family protein [Clostridiales bacterium]|nr:LCP family protein [Clostridiales bacterium]
MCKRLLCWLMAIILLAGTGCALAAQPREIYPLDYDTLPEPRSGQHNYLLACVDNWQGNAQNLGNTDGVMMVTMDVDAKRLMFTTFSREMLIKRPDGGIGRFTYIAKNYGPDALCRTVSTHFGHKVEKYIIFSMDNVQNIIDAMGGVYITVTDAEADYLNRYRIARDATTPSMDKAGTYLFGGHAAVIYMRIRKVGGDGDSGRTRRMRTVLGTLANKYAQASLDDALTLLTSVADNVVTTNMSMADMLEAVGYAMELRGAEPEGIQMPPQEAMESISYAGMSTRQVDFEYSRKKLNEFLESQSFDVIDE